MSSMGFFKNRYYRYNAILLTLIGQWPYQSSKWKRLQQIIIHFDIITVMIVQIIKMFEIWGDLDIMIECFTPVGVQLAACAKSINNMINFDKVRNLLEYMQRDWSSLKNEREQKILGQFAEKGRQMTIVYAIFLFGSLSIYLLIPLLPLILDIILPLNETRQQRYLYHTEHFVNSDDNYYAIAVHTYSGTILTIWTVVAIDTMFATYIQHACGLLAIVGDRLEKISENINLIKCDPNVPIDEDEYYQELICCVKKHKNAIKFAVLIESSYSSSFVFQLGFCMVLISVSLVQLLTKLGEYDEMYRIIQFTIAQLFHLFFNSWSGQKLIDQSAKLSESIYFSGWHEVSLRSKRLIKFVMMNAATPLKITASKFYDMSMENYGMVVQTSISYFTVLASMR